MSIRATSSTPIFLPTSILSFNKFYWIFLGRGLIAPSALLWVGNNNSNKNNIFNDDPKL